ncbi:MAG TPA: holin, BlyA family protein [Candidatus Alectryocaccobium stercorigallinarum]|nr:holin, BlyA family protein [Candidatus Alectryocaccobium stercorigallinarum]
MNDLKRFISEEDAVSTVEIILIVVVLIALVVLFRDQITQIVNNILKKAASQSDAV